MIACPIFPEFKNRSALKTLQALYCEGEYEGCERYKLVKTGVMPDRDLLPNGTKLTP